MLQTLFVEPVYNSFIFLVGVMPGGDVGFAIIALTLIVRIVFYPLFTSSIRTQMALQAVQPEVQEINEQFKDDTVERSRRTAELFKQHRIRPLSFFFSSLVQIAVFITLSYAFFQLGLPKVHTELLYSFVPAPSVVNELFLGFMDLTVSHTFSNAVLAVLVAVLQFFAMRLALSRTPLSPKATPQQQAAQAMQRNVMQYGLPLMMVFFTFTFPAAVGLYIAATNAVSVVQELIIRRRPL